MTKSKVSVQRMVLAALLCAIGIVIPMVMPKVVIGPMSITLASHVAIFIAMFVSPGTAVAVCIGTTIGFFFTTPLIIALRAASHLVFALLGAFYLQRRPMTIEKPLSSILFNAALALVHAIGEIIVVTPFFLSGQAFKPEQLASGYVMSVVLLIGGVCFVHSMIDYTISIAIWRPVRAAMGIQRPTPEKR